MNPSRSLRLRPDIAANVPDTAMVMAAGLGKRMRPLTATRPKPLVELAGKPLIDHVLESPPRRGVASGVNVHYLADSLEAHLAHKAQDFEVAIPTSANCCSKPRWLVQPADDRLRPILVVNSDNFWIDGPTDGLRLLASGWEDDKMDALLLLVPQARAGNHRGQGDFRMDRFGRLSRRARSRVAPYVFTGIQIISKRLLKDAPEGAFSTNLLWDRAMRRADALAWSTRAGVRFGTRAQSRYRGGHRQ